MGMIIPNWVGLMIQWTMNQNKQTNFENYKTAV